ncbi:MAG: hypothetical protein GTO02_15860 [Candidatus Dadabacteria bacterium]|nr:hypothetical protein [Candidatus Dadabacteria bacterium]
MSDSNLDLELLKETFDKIGVKYTDSVYMQKPVVYEVEVESEDFKICSFFFDQDKKLKRIQIYD